MVIYCNCKSHCISLGGKRCYRNISLASLSIIHDGYNQLCSLNRECVHLRKNFKKNISRNEQYTHKITLYALYQKINSKQFTKAIGSVACFWTRKIVEEKRTTFQNSNLILLLQVFDPSRIHKFVVTTVPLSVGCVSVNIKHFIDNLILHY